ncbi:unnamed protein product [Closterium sp. Yama58-4]|nr:unnamed protein product [Closterium sp. Yama58-4]
MARHAEPITARQHIASFLVASLVISIICGPAMIAASELEDAIKTANQGGGTTELVLKSNVQLTAPLPALEGAAVLTITGACAVNRCVISGNNAFPIFTSPSSGPTGGILNLRNLTFQDAAGGVFVNVRTRINATQCGFVNNKGPSNGGGVLSESYSVTKSVSLRYFSLCIFYNNTTPTGGGGALSINSGYPQGQGPALTITGSYFRNNSAPKGQGGVIRVEGTGKVVFKSCLFDGNSAAYTCLAAFVSLSLFLSGPCTLTPSFPRGPFRPTIQPSASFHPALSTLSTLSTLPSMHPGGAGGAIYSNGTSLTFNKAIFRDNKAIGVPSISTCGFGGAVFANLGRYSETSVRFCASSFTGNTGCQGTYDTVFLQMVPGPTSPDFPSTVMYCNGTAKPAGLLAPASGWQELSSCTSSTCD